MKNDIIDVMEACVDGTLDQMDLEFEDNAAVCVVLASEGYPVKYEKGIPDVWILKISKTKTDITVSMQERKFQDGQIVTNGGRVLGITAQRKVL